VGGNAGSSPSEDSAGEGSNSYWLAMNILYNGQALSMEEVMFMDAASYADNWHSLAESTWGNAPTYSFSPTNGPLSLPLSLMLVTPSGEVEMHNVITSFDATVIDSGVEYNQSD